MEDAINLPRIRDLNREIEVRTSNHYLHVQDKYEISSVPRGNVFIYSGETFEDMDVEDTPENRIDAENFEILFNAMGYRCFPRQRDLTDEELLAILDTIVQDQSLNRDCFIGLFGSHGVEGAITTYDNELVTEKEIYAKLDQCNYLRGKPKVFFFVHSRDQPSPFEIEGVGTYIPSETFLWNSVGCGEFSLLANEEVLGRIGSPFIRIVCNVLMSRSHELSLNKLYKEVNRELIRCGLPPSDLIVKNGYASKLYFNPRG